MIYIPLAMFLSFMRIPDRLYTFPKQFSSALTDVMSVVTPLMLIVISL